MAIPKIIARLNKPQSNPSCRVYVHKFVIDFYCPKLKLAIEVDGDSHFIGGADMSDKERQTIIESFGIIFLRFTNREIYENINGVMSKIMENIQNSPPLTPPW